MFNISVAAVFHNQAHMLKPFLDHWLTHGVEHFYLTNFQSSDDYINVLIPYLTSGVINLYQIDSKPHDRMFEQAFFSCLKNDMACSKTNWMVFLPLNDLGDVNISEEMVNKMPERQYVQGRSIWPCGKNTPTKWVDVATLPRSLT